MSESRLDALMFGARRPVPGDRILPDITRTHQTYETFHKTGDPSSGTDFITQYLNLMVPDIRIGLRSRHNFGVDRAVTNGNGIVRTEIEGFHGGTSFQNIAQDNSTYIELNLSIESLQPLMRGDLVQAET